ncbi:MAG TPA: NAD-dependent epimerase/dehydratase family protein [Pirellula sp.]|nr:NAD-dependent epimerase/dehydratase family protein [Pirellula sp.]
MSASILVTGYGGFLGRAICRELIRHGYRVRGLARNKYPELEAIGVECLKASATAGLACDDACRGMDGVIHTAARAGVWGPAKLYEQINVAATDNLLSSCRKLGIGAFVYTSSPSVTFDGSAQCNINESVPYPTQWLCHYPRTKAIAEQLILNANDSTRFATCSLRPHLIWGVGDPHLIPRVIERCRSGRLRRVGDGTNLIDTAHVDHVAIAHRLALERMLDRDQNASGRAYFITDGEPIECWKWITTILESANMTPPKKCISFNAAYRLGAVLELVYRLLRISSEPPMTRFVAAQLGVDHYFDISSAKNRLGFQPIQNRWERVAELGSQRIT